MGKQRLSDAIEQEVKASSNTPLEKLNYNPLSTNQFKESQKINDLSKTVKNDRSVKDYLPYVTNVNLEDNDLDAKRADGQSVGEQFGNALVQFAGQFAGGAAMALGTTLDVEQSVKTIMGTEKEYKNLLFDFGKGLIESSREAAPIYEKDPGEVNPSDSAWWASMFANTGLSAGIMVESMAETMALSALTGGTGLSTAVSNVGRKSKMLSSLKSLMGAGDAASKLRTQATLFGVINRHHEGIMEAADSFETEYASLKQKGLSEEKAKEGAALAASTTYKANLPLMALDIAQFRAMTFNPISGGSKGGVIENILGGLKSKTLAKGIGATFGMASEGGEEYWQALAQQEAKEYADTASGVGSGKDFKQRFAEFNEKGETWNATISGVFGGAILGGASHLMGKMTESKAAKSFSKEYDAFVKSTTGIGAEMMNQIRTLDEQGEPGKANNLRRSMGIQKALHAVHLDNLKDSDAAFATYTSYMQGLLDTVTSGDQAQIDALGVTGSEDFIKENVPNYLADAQKIQAIYDQVKQNNHRDAVVPITYRRFLQDNLSEESAKLTSTIAAVEATIPDMQNISSPGRVINDASINIQLFQSKIKSLQKELDKEGISETERESINSGLLYLNLAVAANEKKIEEQKEAVANLEVTQKQQDDDILSSVNRNAHLQRLKGNKADVDTQLARTRKELSLWTDPDFQVKGQREKIYATVNASETIEELDTTEQTLMAQGVFSGAIQEKIESKRKELRAKQETEALTNKNPLPVNTPEQRAGVAPKPSPIEQAIAQSVQEEEASQQSIPEEAPALSATAFFGGTLQPSAERQSIAENLNNVLSPTPVVEAPVTPSAVGTTTEAEPVPMQATVINQEYDDLFEPGTIPSDLSEDKKEGIKTRFAEYYNSLAVDLGRNPTFREVVEDMISNTSAIQTEKNFNVLKLGWELNNYAQTDFNKVYNDLFGTRKSKAQDFFAYAEQSVLTEQESRAEQEAVDQQEALEQAPPKAIETLETGEKIYLSTAEFQTVEPTLKFAHLSQTYEETITEENGVVTIDRKTNTDELNQSAYVDSKELMNPNLYAAGTVLDVKVPEDMGKILLSQWGENYQKLAPISFEEWAKDKDPNSDEYIGRMPMIIYNGEKGVAFVHDVEWYNPANIGGNPMAQKETIREARAKLLAFRKAVLANNGSKITITEKRPGTKMQIPDNKPKISIAESNPDAVLGIANQGGVNIGGETIPYSQLMNTHALTMGHRYHLRHAGMNPDGTKQYFAAKVLYDTLPQEAVVSIAQAIRVYVNSKRKTAEVKPMRDQILRDTGLDLFSQVDAEKYINLFMPTAVKGATPKQVADVLASDSKIPTETPYIVFTGGAVVMGIKDKKLTNNEKSGFTATMHPDNNHQGVDDQVQSFLSRLIKPDFLPKVKQNMTANHLEDNTPVAFINSTEKPVPYKDYLKQQFKTDLKSIRLDDGSFTSFTQPVIQFSYDTEAKSVTPSGAEILPTVEIKPTTPVLTAASTVQQIAAQVTGNPAPAPVVDQEATLIKSIADSIEDFERLGLSEEAMQALRNLTSQNQGEALFDPEYEKLTDDIVQSIKKKLTKIADLEIIDRSTVVQFIANQVMTEINPQDRTTLSKAELIKKVNNSFNAIIAPKVKLVDAKIEALRTLEATGKYPNLDKAISQMENLRANATVLQNNWSDLITEAFNDYVEKFTGITVKINKDQINVEIKEEGATIDLNQEEEDQQDFQVEENNQREKDHSKESIEDNGKNSASYLTKRFLAQIPEYDKSGKPKMGYMGLTAYPGFDYYHNAISTILASPTTVGSSLKEVLTRLEEHSIGKPWIAEVIKRLNESDEQMKNAFMYDLVRHALTMKFVMYSFNSKTGQSELQVYDTNANEITRVIQNQWKEAFKQSPLSNNNGQNYTINPVKAKELLAEFETWSKKLPEQGVAAKWLSNFGIHLSEETMQELFKKGYTIIENRDPIKYNYQKMFDKTGATHGVFGLMARYLEKMAHPGVDLNYMENKTVNPFDDSSGVLNKLAYIQSKYSLNLTTNSFRDGTKSIFGYTPNKFATSYMDELVTDAELRAKKLGISFDQNSYILNLLENDPDFRGKVKVDHLGINAFKELGKKLFKDNELNSLADADHEATKLGMFQDKRQGKVKSKTYNGLPLRIARMFFPTMSDKKTMLDLTTAVLDLSSKHFSFDDAGRVTINEKVKDFMFHQMIEPELKRIIAHHARAKKLQMHPNEVNNQKGYNLGAQIFNMIPAMNNVMFKGQTGDIRLIEYLADAAGIIDKVAYGALLENIKGQSHDLLDNMFNQLADEKIAVWDSNDFLVRTEGVEGISSTQVLDGAYMRDFTGTMDQRVKTAALDFIINSAITNANTHMLFSGDVANYSQDKAFKGKVQQDNEGRLLPYKPLNDQHYFTMSENVVSVNLGKRLALLIAPGATIAQSKGDRYVQLFLKDRESMSENIEFIIDLYYGSTARTAAVNEKLQTAKLQTKEGGQAIKDLKDLFPAIGDYFAIESTDAQEYTTVKEHLDILFRQGRVSVKQYQDFNSKIKRQKEAEKAGRAIPSDAILSDLELKTIFQPIKPVYTGQLQDKENDVSRMMYIKSSSFPLLPQMTSAFPALDGLRKKMEELEERTKSNVRASYDTANKVGAVLGKNQLQVWDQDGNFIPDSINVEDIATKLENEDDTSAMYLDRKFFRIQQDVPFKSAKKTSQDTVTLGTQMMKLIFGNGIAQISGNVFNGKSGDQLLRHYNNMFEGWISSEKTKLYESLGIDESTGQAIDKKATIKKLQALLKNEATKRGYPTQDIEALELDDNGDLSDEIAFTIPLWLSPNSNRYEAMLNAMVTNRLLNLKLPGASFVAASEEGFKVTEDASAIDQSKVIFTSKWDGTLRAASDKNLAQVLMPSKFRGRDGKLLDLMQKDESGNFMYITEETKGTYRLKENMIDQELLSNSTFRIPTSSHVSMAQVEIVGFLPVESGDLIVVPKNFTKQKGLDFDVDKENVYMLHQTLDENGKIISVSNQDFSHESIKDDIKYLQETIEEYRAISADNQAQIQEYQDEIEVNTELGIDTKDAKKFITEIRKDGQANKDNLKAALKALKDLKALEIQLYQNEIIGVYSAVLGSKDTRVQRKINKVLSTDYAEAQANEIEALIKTGSNNSNFSILSDEYQKFKMGLGAAGKLGIGVYSNYVVFHSLIQQNSKPITLLTPYINEEGKTEMVPYKLNLGGLPFEGTLGEIMTLDGSREITDVLAERQNTATDNEKLQIMGKAHINELTINVDSVLSLMGFDKSLDNGNSIAYYLLSQPIIRDYVAETRKTKSSIAGFDKDAQAKVLKKLYQKYNITENIEETERDLLRQGLTGDKLRKGITSKGADTKMQQVVFELFMELDKFGADISSLQKKLNIQSSGLGKSIFEMRNKYNNVEALSRMPSIDNVGSLIGKYVSRAAYNRMSEEDKKGFVVFPQGAGEGFAVKPNTVTGSLVVHSAKAGYELWSDYFPHQDRSIQDTFNQIMDLISNEDVSESRKLTLQHEVFGEMKKYLFSSGKIGTFSGDPQLERARLFFNTEGNTALADYLFNLSNSNHPAKELIVANKLLGRFTYTLDEGDMPSLIKYDNSKSEDFNEEYKYMALVELMDKNVDLPKLNGKPYTSRMLAKDLINYSYLSGGVQGAIEFTKYIPVSYLKEMGFAQNTQIWQSAASGKTRPGLWQMMLGSSVIPTVAGRFVTQYLQHNPSRLEKKTEEDMIDPVYSAPKPVSKGTIKPKPTLGDLQSFKLKPGVAAKSFVSVYNKNIAKGRPKFQVYQHDGEKYVRIPTLGVFGMVEYSMKVDSVNPLVDTGVGTVPKTVPAAPVAVAPQPATDVKPFALEENNLEKTLNQVIAAKLGGTSHLAQVLLPYIDQSTQIKVGVVNGGNSRASYLNNTITLDTTYLAGAGATPSAVGRTIVHEYVHALTTKVLDKYFDRAGSPIAPLNANMQRLHRLFQATQKALGEEKLAEFQAFYSKKENRGTVRDNGTDRLMYGASSIHEFTAMIMAEEDLQRAMSEIPYAQTGRTLLEQFVLSIKRVLSELGIVFKEGSITSEAMDTVFAIIEENKPAQKATDSSNPFATFGISSISKEDQEIDHLLSKEDQDEIDDPLLEPSYQQEDNLDETCIF